MPYVLPGSATCDSGSSFDQMIVTRQMGRDAKRNRKKAWREPTKSKYQSPESMRESRYWIMTCPWEIQATLYNLHKCHRPRSSWRAKHAQNTLLGSILPPKAVLSIIPRKSYMLCNAS